MPATGDTRLAPSTHGTRTSDADDGHPAAGPAREGDTSGGPTRLNHLVLTLQVVLEDDAGFVDAVAVHDHLARPAARQIEVVRETVAAHIVEPHERGPHACHQLASGGVADRR
jgi:hypothetical protein